MTNLALSMRNPLPQLPVKKDARWWTEWNLENWATHMQGIELPEGLPPEASGGLQCYTSEDLENEDEYDKLCANLADTTSRVIVTLPEAERSAIMHRYIAGACYEFYRVKEPYGLALASAMPLVEDGLRRRGVWLGE